MAWAEKYEAEKALKLNGSYTKADVIDAYRAYVKASHPDIGGNHDEMIAVNKAKDFMVRVLFKDEPADRAFTCEASKDSEKKTSSAAASAKPATTAPTNEKKSEPAPSYSYRPVDVEPVEEAWWEKSAKVETPVDPGWEAAFNKYCSEFFTDSSDTPKPEPDPVQNIPTPTYVDVEEATYEAYVGASSSRHKGKSSPIYRFANFMLDGFPWKTLFAIACLAYALFYPLDLDDYANCWVHVLSVVALVINCASGIFTGILSLPFRLLRAIAK